MKRKTSLYFLALLLSFIFVTPVFAAPFEDIVDRSKTNILLMDDGGYKFKPTVKSDTKVPDWCGKIIYSYYDGNTLLTKTIVEPAADLAIYNVVEATLYVKGAPPGKNGFSDQVEVVIADKAKLDKQKDGGYRYKSDRPVKLKVPVSVAKLVYYDSSQQKTITIKSPKAGEWLSSVTEATLYYTDPQKTEGISVENKSNLTLMSDTGYKFLSKTKVDLIIPSWCKKIIYWDGKQAITLINPKVGSVVQTYDCSLYLSN